MATLKLTAFTGEIPRILPRLLPDMASTHAFNTRLTDGSLDPIRLPRKIQTINSLADGDNTIYYDGAQWLSYPGVVNIVPGPVAASRLYIFGDGAPRVRVNGVERPLAITTPSSALSASVTGTGAGDVETRLYAYTFVTDLGEETPPSPLTDEVEWETGQTVTLSGFEVGDSARGVNTQRIYRSQTGQTGTDLYLIAERPASTGDFTDNIAPSDFDGQIPSTLWGSPPDDLEGLISMPNGMMAAFRGHEVWFCEPYRPHAWPESYILTVDYPIVGLGAYSSTLVIMTEGHPYIAQGSSPETMIMEELELNLPCVNKRGIVDLGYAIAYPSHDGLVVASQGGARVATESLFSRNDWLELDPGAFVCSQFDGRYYASYTFTNDLNEVESGALIIDLSGEQPFIIRTDIEADAFFYDLTEGNLYYLEGDGIFLWDARGRPNAIQSWWSKEFVMPAPTNFGAILIEVVDSLTPSEIAAIEEEIAAVKQENEDSYDSELDGEVNGEAVNVFVVNGDTLKTVPILNRNVSVNVYADGKLYYSVSRFNTTARLPAGFKARRWQVEITGDMQVEQVALATTAAELRSV